MDRWGPSILDIEYDEHAVRRMAERKIRAEQVVCTLEEYDTDLPAKWGRRNRYKMIEGRRIRVTFDQEANGRIYVWTVTADEVRK